ncbi:MAG: arsenate reductase family protein [Sphaerochaeta sp.]|jgi:arsenate reductase|nr:arsenate reductase family protein [Sphaerochaeta sp.]MDX9914805.1 arsenate reductase family protein [Sphaerochaeta sp.]
MTIICYPRCSTCRKAQRYLTERGIAYTYRDIKEDRPSKEELTSFIERSGVEAKRFFNTSGQRYRDLALKDRVKEMSREEIVELLSTDGMLVKRPLLISEHGVLVGFKEAEWETHLRG